MDSVTPDPSAHSDTPARAAELFEALNPQQLAAVRHGIGEYAHDTRPLLVIAGAGSGKTNTLAHRVTNLLLHGADPQRILMLTFSRRAAQEMERRVGSVLQRALKLKSGGAAAPSLPWAGTFHSVGARLLREYAARIGLDESFTIHDRGDAEDLLGLVRQELGLATNQKRFPMKGTCLSIYSRAVNTCEPLGKVLALHFPWCAQWEEELKRLFGAYVEAKQSQNVLDYDDLLLFWSEMVADPVLAAELGARFDHVLVDEYQDTNALQAVLVTAMKPDGRGVTVVGDDAQSIYSFRGATVRNILDFPRQFTQEAAVVALERNYRSTQPILEVSNAVIAQARERHAKQLFTDRQEGRRAQLVTVPDEASQARWVAERVLAHREGGLSLTQQAVLFRTASHSAALELELARRDIPFVKFGGLKFLEAAHVKDMLAILRFAQNPRGRMAGFRMLQLMPGIGPATATRLLDQLEVAADPLDVVRSFEPGGAGAQEWPAFVALYTALRRPGLAWPADLTLASQWYLPHLERLHDDAHARKSDVEQLVRLGGAHGSRERFLAELTLDPPQATSDLSGPPGLDEDYLILSTIHSAKGQEWKSVHVLSVVDGCIPSDMATGSADDIEEERRLLYVAMTRARDHLHLLVPHRYYVTQQGSGGDRHVYAARTRYVGDAQLAGFEQVTWPEATSAPASAAASGGVRMQVRERARAAWR